jgi:uncharacterized protein GlcG (DUF336 family)
MNNKLMSIVSGLVVILNCAAALAQPPPAADPTRLPGDAPPPELAAMLRPPSNRPPQPPDTTPGVAMELALAGARAALDACSSQGLRVGVVVTNSEGQLQIGLAADGANPGRILFATRKSLAALAFKMPTSAVQAKLRTQDATALAMLKANMVVYPGALPIILEGKAIGAIGASGATGEQDEACAAVGAEKIKSKLK